MIKQNIIMRLFFRFLTVFVLKFLFLTNLSFAQQQNVIPYMQSPNAAGLGSFGNFDVSYFTGLPNISVPVFSLKEGDISVNCELKYLGGGVKPSAHPGWVGQNWSLGVGGIITRKVNGGVDEVANSQGSPANQAKIDQWSYLVNYSLLSPSNWYTNSFIQNFWENTATNGNSSDWTKEPYPAPDEFAFTLPTGVAGSFYLNHLGNWVVQTKNPSNLKINVQTNSVTLNNYQDGTSINIYRAIYVITITDEAGFIYTFGNNPDAIEFSRGPRNQLPIALPFNEDVVANSWYLTKIQSPTGNIVNFTYSRHENIYVQNVAYPSAETISSTSLLGAGGAYYSQQTTASFSGQVISPVYLTQISSRSFNVNFTISKSTQLNYPYQNVFKSSTFNYGDLEVNDWTQSTVNFVPTITAWYKLDLITVNDFNNVTREKYSFTYNNDATQRLFLGEFRKLNLAASNADIVYHFNYNCTPLPAYNSMQQDQWGYYNGNQFPNTVTLNSSLLNYFTMNNTYAQAGILQSIIYPTGGTTTFNWEPNDYSNVLQKSGNAINLVSQTGVGGGLRIASIVNNDNNGNTYTKSYVYKKITNGVAGASGGILAGYNKILYTNVPLANPALVNMSFIDYDDYSKCLDYSNGRDVVYSEVQEVFPDGSYKLYDYSNSDNSLYRDEKPFNVYSDAFNISNAVGGTITSALTSSYSYPLLSHCSRDLERGQLLTEKSYTPGNVLIKQIQYVYNPDTTRFNNYVRCYDNYSVTASNGNNFTSERYFQAIKIYTYFLYLQSKTTTLYDQTGANPVSTTETYTWDINYRNKKTETFTSSDGLQSKINLSYPPDAISGLSTGALNAKNAMVTANITNIPLEKFIYKNNIQTGHERTDYAIFTGANGNFMMPSVFYKSVSTLALEPRIQYNSYDGYGHLLEEQKVNDVKHIYLWGYKNSYPVADITGSNYATVSSIVSASQSTLDNPSSDQALRTALNSIRTGISGSVAHVNTYTYTPLTGMTSQTDPTGKTTYYVYDGLNRLTLVQDINSNIVKEYSYNSSFQGKTFSNSVLVTYFSRSNCASLYQGSSVPYTVPQGRYTSTFSQCAADQAAANDAAANGPTNANTNGICYPAIEATSTIANTVTVKLTNTSTGSLYTYLIAANHSNQPLGYVPPGTYNINVCQNASTGQYVFQINNTLVNGNGATCFNVLNQLINTPSDGFMFVNPRGGGQ